MVFSTHSSGLTLTDTLGAFRHKQDLSPHLACPPSTIDFNVYYNVLPVVLSRELKTYTSYFSIRAVHIFLYCHMHACRPAAVFLLNPRFSQSSLKKSTALFFKRLCKCSSCFCLRFAAVPVLSDYISYKFQIDMLSLQLIHFTLYVTARSCQEPCSVPFYAFFSSV